MYQTSNRFIFLILAAPDKQLWRHDESTNQLVNKDDETQVLDVDSSNIKLVVQTGTGTIMKDQDTVFGLDDNDVTKNPNVVEEDLKDGVPDEGQTWTVTEVEQKPTETNKFYTFSIKNYFLTAGLTVQGKKQ